MTQSRDEDLAEIVAEAEKLKMCRGDGAAYLDKCDEVVRITKLLFENMDPKSLSTADINKIKIIKKLLVQEEIFAQRSSELRDPQNWLRLPDD